MSWLHPAPREIRQSKRVNGDGLVCIIVDGSPQAKSTGSHCLRGAGRRIDNGWARIGRYATVDRSRLAEQTGCQRVLAPGRQMAQTDRRRVRTRTRTRRGRETVARSVRSQKTTGEALDVEEFLGLRWISRQRKVVWLEN